MKRIFALTLAILFTIFTLPVNGLTTMAEEKTYNDIKDGTYDITAKAMHENKNESSGAQGFINKKAKLSVQDGKVKLTIDVPNKEIASVEGLQVEGSKAQVKEDNNIKHHTFNLSNLKKELNARVQYRVGTQEDIHDVPLRFHLEGLDDLPLKENEVKENEVKEDEAKEDNVKSEAINLNNGYYTTKANYIRDDNNENSSMGRHLSDSVFINSKDGMYYLTITIKNDKTVTQLKINNKIAKQKVVNKNKRHETFEFDNLNSLSDAYVEYQVPMKDKVHKGNANFRIVLDSNFSPAKAEDQPGKLLDNNNESDSKPKPKVKPEQSKENPKTVVKPKTKKDKATLIPDKAYNINYQIKDEKDKEVSSADSFFVKPGSLLEKEGILYAQLTINQGDLIQNLSTKKYGDVLIVKENKDGSIVVQFRIDNNLSNILLNMQIVVPNMPEYAGKHNALLKFDKKSKKEIKASEFKLVASNTENGPNPIAGEPEAKPINEDKKEKKQKQTTEVNGKKVDESITKKSYDTKKLVPNKAYTINYSIKHEDGVKTSMADEFFKKPGKLLEKDGVLYAQFTITNGNMVKQLSTEFGDALIVKKNKDGSIVVQFKVNKDLSNMKLSMLIDVPGLYTETHEAVLVFDKNSKKEIDASKEKLVASSSANGPTVKGGIEGKGLGYGGGKDNKDALTNLSNGGPDKPEFGSNGNGGLNDKGKSTNPQTGDLTNIWLYAFLLAGSLLILGVKFRRRTI